MNSRTILTFVLFSVFALGAVSQTRAVSTPAMRQATLKTLELLLAAKASPETGAATLKDPFNPPGQDLQEDFDPNAMAKAPAQASRRTGDELMQEIAKQIQPTGTVTLGGEPFLLFGEKRRKMGEKVTVSIDGVEYEVEFGRIETSRFRIRCNNDEIIRSIK